MKKRSKTTRFLGKTFLSLALTLLLWYCKKEITMLETPDLGALKPHIEILSYPQLLEDADIQEKLVVITPFFETSKPAKHLHSKEVAIGNDFVIDTTQVIRVTTAQTISWTFGLQNNTQQNSLFENFMIKKHEEVYKYYHIVYAPSENDLDPYLPKLYEISEDLLLTNEILNVLSRDDHLTTTDPDDGGGGNASGCEGEIYTEIEPCNQNGYHEPKYACQHQFGTWHGMSNIPPCDFVCTGTTIVTYIDFSHCNGGAYETPGGPDHTPPNPSDPTAGGGGGSTLPNSINENPTVTVPVTDARCTQGKILVNDVCVCPEGKEEDEEGNCVCPEGYQENSRAVCIQEGHCYELDKLMYGTQSHNPYIADGTAGDPTGKNTRIRIAVTNMYENVNSNWEHGYGFYNKGNYPDYGPYAHHVPAQGENHINFPSRLYQFGTLHTHPVNNEAIPMFSHDDLYSLLKIRETYMSSAFYSSNNMAGNDLFVNMLVVQQGGATKVYAIKIKNYNKFKILEDIYQTKKVKDDFIKDLTDVYSDEDGPDGVNGSAVEYQKAFLEFIKDQDLGLDLYEMEQLNAGTPEVEERWHQLTLNITGVGNPVIKIPCNNT